MLPNLNDVIAKSNVEFFVGCDPSSKVSRFACVSRDLQLISKMQFDHTTVDWDTVPDLLLNAFPLKQTIGILIEDQYIGFNMAVAKNLIQAQAQIHTLFSVLGYNVGLVLPSVWQNKLLKDVVFTKNTKKKSVFKAKELFGIEGKLDHNYADAMLIAVYGLTEGI